MAVEYNTVWMYLAEMMYIVDGDTVDVLIDLGFGVKKKERVRLAGIDTPEMFSVKKDSEEYAKGEAARAFVVGWSQICSDLIIVKTVKEKGKYGRYIAEIYNREGDECLNDALVEAGHAVRKEY